MKTRKACASVTCVCLFFVLLGTSSSLAEDVEVAPAAVQASLLVKLLAFNKHLASGCDICVHVIRCPEFAAAMKKGIGIPVGKGRISSVTEGDGLPTERPAVVYVADSSMTDAVIEYTRANDVLSMTGLPDQVEKGVTLGVGVKEGKPKILLNVSSSKQEDIDWNPAVLKIATIYK